MVGSCGVLEEQRSKESTTLRYLLFCRVIMYQNIAFDVLAQQRNPAKSKASRDFRAENT